MLRSIISLFQRPALDRLEAFRARFAGRTIIVHRGLSPDWVDELTKQPGGAGHFRIDARRLPASQPTPIEWVAQNAFSHGLPLPLILRVEAEGLRVRHLTRAGEPVHPSEIAWMLKELPRRYHLFLRFEGQGFAAVPGIPVTDNRVSFEEG